MKVETKADIKEALTSILRPDAKFTIILHTLEEGYKVKSHFHPDANEWLVLFRGKAKVMVNGESRVVASSGRVKVIEVPRGISHSLASKAKSEYLVVRDGNTSTIDTSFIYN